MACRLRQKRMKDANVDLNPQDYYRCQNVLYHFKDLCRSALSNNYPSRSTSIFWCHHCYSSAVLECNGFCGWTILLLIKVCQKHLASVAKLPQWQMAFEDMKQYFDSSHHTVLFDSKVLSLSMWMPSKCSSLTEDNDYSNQNEGLISKGTYSFK